MPATVVSQDSSYSTRFSTQRKPFKNPRGLKYFYALLYYLDTGTTYELRIYRSVDGVTWNDYQVVKTFASDIYGSSSLWIYDDGSQLIVFITYADANKNIFYKRGTIADNASTLTLGDETQFIWASETYYATRPVITRAADNFLWIAYNRYGSGDFIYRYCTGRLPHDPPLEWTRVGANPYLGMIDYPVNYVYTASDLDEIGDFSYIDTMVGGSCYMELYCKGDGNDTVTVHVWDDIGKMWLTAGTITPSTSWSWKFINLTSLGFTTITKINGIKMYMVYRKVQAAHNIEVDCSRLRIVPDAAQMIYCRASTKANPQSSFLTEDAGVGDDHVHVADSSKFAVDDYITIHDDIYPSTLEHFKQITSIVGDALYLDSALSLGVSVADNAQALHWSNEHEIEKGSATYESVPTVVPLEATYDVLILYKWRNDLLYTWRRGGKEVSWDGTAFTDGYADGERASNTPPTEQGVLPAVCDSTNNVHFLHKHSNYLYHDYWIVGSGFNAGDGVGSLLQISVNYASLSIDRTSSPNILYAFYLPVGGDEINVKKTPVDVISWTADGTIPDTGGYISASYRDLYEDLKHKFYIMYMKNGDVRFVEYPLPVVKVQYSDGFFTIVAG